jgi:hypothetical protein
MKPAHRNNSGDIYFLWCYSMDAKDTSSRIKNYSKWLVFV